MGTADREIGKYLSRIMKCLLCFQKTQEYFNYGKYTGQPFGLVQCQNCGLIQTEPLPAAEFLREWYARYDVLGEREPYYQALARENPWLTPEGLAIAHQFARLKRAAGQSGWPKSRIRCLDLGSGQGLFLDLVKRAGWQGQGIELSARAASRSRERFGIQVSSGTIFEARLPSVFFQIVTLWDIFEHLSDPLEVLTEVQRVLIPGGLLFIETPNAGSFLDRVVLWLSRFGFSRPAVMFYGLHHLTLWNPRNLSQALTERGFRVKSVERDSTPASRVFRGSHFLERIQCWAVDFVQFIGRALGRENKMIILAEKL